MTRTATTPLTYSVTKTDGNAGTPAPHMADRARHHLLGYADGGGRGDGFGEGDRERRL